MPEDPDKKKDYLSRLIEGLKQTIENQKFELPYYQEGDVMLTYAKKFIAACEQNLLKAQKELAELERGEKCGP